MAGVYDITLGRGESLLRTFTVTRQTNGTPVSYAGYSALMHVRRDPADTTTPLLVAGTTDGRLTVTGDNQNTWTLSVPKTATAALPVGRFFYDIMLTDPSGANLVFLGGRFVVLPVSTRAP
jgi:hypothetical protein